MKLLKIFPKNFINLILGRSVLNIADSFYMVAVTIALVEVYNIEASTLTSFALIGMIPSLVAFSYSYFFNKIKNTKFWILCFQIMHIILVSLLIFALVNKAHIAFIFIYNFLFNLVNCVLTSLNVKVTPEVLDNDNNLIKKSVDIQYFTSNSLDILSNFVASLLLGFITYLSLMQLSIPIFLAGVYFFTKLNLNKNIKIICMCLIVIVIAGIIFFIVDYNRVKNNLRPVFCIENPVNAVKDGGTVEFLGLGYKVIDFHTVAGFDDIKIGTWFMNYNDFDSEMRAYEIEFMQHFENK